MTSLTVLLFTQAWSGAPLYLLASVLQGLWLHRSGGLGKLAIVGVALFSTALTILAGMVLWVRVFGPAQGIMLYGVINLPAAIACVVLFPVLGFLCRTSFADRNRR